MCRETGHLRAPIQSNHLRGGRQGLTPAPSEEDENMRSAYFRKLIFQTVRENCYWLYKMENGKWASDEF
jgi:hypothetical protein